MNRNEDETGFKIVWREMLIRKTELYREGALTTEELNVGGEIQGAILLH